MSVINYIGQMLPSMLLAAIIFIIVRIIGRFIKKCMLADIQWRHEILLLIFIVFSAGLASQTIIPVFYVRSGFDHIGLINLVPFHKIGEIINAVKHGQWDYIVIEVLGNIVMFIPFGLLLPMLWRTFRRFWVTLLMCFAISMLIELVQLAIPFRVTDVDDLIMNTLGGVIGYLFYSAYKKITSNKKQVQA